LETALPAVQTSKPKPRRKKTRRSGKAYLFFVPRRWSLRIALAGVLLFLMLVGVGALARRLAPSGNIDRLHYDTLIVLGMPADDDGNASGAMQQSLNEAVLEYQRGAAQRIIVTGGKTHREFYEAKVMARELRARGVPASAIFVEDRAMNTIQNARFSAQIMREQSMRSAEVITLPAHVSRAGIIFNRLPILWRMHAAPRLWPVDQKDIAWGELVEDLKASYYLFFSRWMMEWKP